MKINDNTSNTSPTLHGKSFTSNIKLGLYFDSNLSRKYHIDYFCHKKSNTTVGIIAKIRHFVPHHVLLCVYPALILCISPYLHYGVWCAWCEAATTHLTMQLNKISTSFISLQRRTLYKPANQRVSGFKRNKCSYFC